MRKNFFKGPSRQRNVSCFSSAPEIVFCIFCCCQICTSYSHPYTNCTSFWSSYHHHSYNYSIWWSRINQLRESGISLVQQTNIDDRKGRVKVDTRSMDGLTTTPTARIDKKIFVSMNFCRKSFIPRMRSTRAPDGAVLLTPRNRTNRKTSYSFSQIRTSSSALSNNNLFIANFNSKIIQIQFKNEPIKGINPRETWQEGSR